MARFEFRLPDIGEGIAEAEIVAWHVKVGDRITEDQGIADLMTDKATVELESPVSGVVIELAGAAGEMIAIGATLVAIETEGEGAKHVSVSNVELEASPTPYIPPPAPNATPIDVGVPSTQALASPAVRARANALGIDLAQVKVIDGARIRHADLDAFLSYNKSYAPSAVARPDEMIKVIGLRRKIAENMAASKRHIPHFSFVEEIDVTKLEEMRADLNANRRDRPKLTALPLLIVAICRALPTFPMINARFDDEAGVVTRFGAVHLGIATQTDAGLMVPVLRDAQERNIWQLARELSRLAEAARRGKAKADELSGSTLTLTSLGPLGGVASTPVINRPEVAIIGPNRIIERPVIRDGEIGSALLMNLSISCDHRVVDGWDAASFVQAVKNLLETPVLLFAD